MAIDFKVLKELSEEARKLYGMGGAVQHGASTLPDSAFHKFVDAGACEVHLATAFQTLIMDHPATPEPLRKEIGEWLKVNAKNEWTTGDTEAQFIYKARKKAVGPFKKQFWSLPAASLDAIGGSLEKQFAFLFEQLAIGGTTAVIAAHVPAREIHRPLPQGGVGSVKGESTEGLAD